MLRESIRRMDWFFITESFPYCFILLFHWNICIVCLLNVSMSTCAKISRRTIRSRPPNSSPKNNDADQLCGDGCVNSSDSGYACRSHNRINTRLFLEVLLPLIASCVEEQSWNYTSRVSGKKKSNSLGLQELALRGLIKHGAIRWVRGVAISKCFLCLNAQNSYRWENISTCISSHAWTCHITYTTKGSK